MPKPDSTQLSSTQPERRANTVHTGTTQVTNPDRKQLPDTPPLGLWGSTWQNPRYYLLFWVFVVTILFSTAVAALPSLFASVNPSAANLRDSLAPARDGHPMGFIQQGYDIYARVIYDARVSVIVGIGVILAVTVAGIILGAIAGHLGGWADAMLSRITDMFFVILLILADIVPMQPLTERTVWSVVLVLVAFGWPQMACVAHPSAISMKNEEYVTVPKAFSLSNTGIPFRHVLSNCLAPVTVMATTLLGIHTVAEAALPYLGIGLSTITIFWGNDISVAQQVPRQAPSDLFWPALALVIIVLGFILMDDALKDSLDPKKRRR